MLFPPLTTVVFAADGSGFLKARLRPGTAARDIKRKKARKISDNLVQYHNFWKKEPIYLRKDEIVLIETVSRYTEPNLFLASEVYIEKIFRRNEYVCRLFLPHLS